MTQINPIKYLKPSYYMIQLNKTVFFKLCGRKESCDYETGSGIRG